MIAEAIGGLMWWWILVHCWYQPEHVLVSSFGIMPYFSFSMLILFFIKTFQGDFPFPDPSKWTNAELGIKDN